MLFIKSKGAYEREVLDKAKKLAFIELEKAKKADPLADDLDSVESLLSMIESHLTELDTSFKENRTAMQSIEVAEREYNTWALNNDHRPNFGTDKVAEANFWSLVVSRRDIDRATLVNLQDSYYEKAHSSPFIASASNCMTNWIIGSGFDIKCLQPDVAAFLQEEMTYIQLDRLIRDMVKDCWIDGEQPIIHDISPKTGLDLWTPVPAPEITEIETKKNVRNPLSYYRVVDRDLSGSEWIASANYYEQLKNDRLKEISDHAGELNPFYLLQMIKYGSGSLINGRPPLSASIKHFTMLEQLVRDRVNLVHHVSTIVWIVKIYRRTAEALRRRWAPPDGNNVLVELANQVEYSRVDPKIQAGDVTEDILLNGYTAASGVGMPFALIQNRADLEVYASLRSNHTEFSQNVAAGQQMWSWALRDGFRISIRGAVQSADKPIPDMVSVPRFSSESAHRAWKVLHDMLREPGITSEEVISELVTHVVKADKKMVEVAPDRVNIEIIPSQIVSDDPLSQAQTLEIHLRNELVSKTTAAAMAGFDLAAEVELMRQEQDSMSDLTPRTPDAILQGRGAENPPKGVPSKASTPKGKVRTNVNPNNNTTARRGGERK